MNFTFTPDRTLSEIEVPYFEDATTEFAPYYTVLKNAKFQGAKSSEQILKGQAAIAVELGKLGGIVTAFIPGVFGTGSKKRYGYDIHFMYGGARGIIHVAGLPMRSETSGKKDAVLVQALWNVRDWLKSAVTNRVFSPGSDALIPFMLVEDNRTVAEYIAEKYHLPLLGNGA